MEAVTPRPAATLILLRDGSVGPEALMLRRPGRGQFGGLWVFPGGAVDAADHSDICRRAVTAPQDCDDLPWRAAALRETLEEVGILLTEPAQTRRTTERGERLYQDVVAAGTPLDGESIRPLSQWVTPVGLPVRFDARFYLTRFHGDPELYSDPAEAEEVGWIRPADALHRQEEGEWAMATPTLHHLRWLARFPSVDSAWDAAADITVQTVRPVIETDGSEVRLRLPKAARLP